MQTFQRWIARSLLILIASAPGSPAAEDFEARVTHGFADQGGVKIHYASPGTGPLLIIIHGFPDYYRRDYPRLPYRQDTSAVIKVQCPVLMIHGLDDWALLPGALNDTWNWIDNDLTLLTVPEAGHFVQHDATDLVNRTIRSWLAR